jgi:hypothetical protein
MVHSPGYTPVALARFQTSFGRIASGLLSSNGFHLMAAFVVTQAIAHLPNTCFASHNSQRWATGECGAINALQDDGSMRRLTVF